MLQVGFRCTSCQFVYLDKVSQCDCTPGEDFRFIEVMIINIRRDKGLAVPLASELKHTKRPWKSSPLEQYQNAVTVDTGKLYSNGDPRTKIIATVSGLAEGDGSRDERDSMFANMALVSAVNEMLEACYMQREYLMERIEKNPNNTRLQKQLQVVNNAILKATTVV